MKWEKKKKVSHRPLFNVPSFKYSVINKIVKSIKKNVDKGCGNVKNEEKKAHSIRDFDINVISTLP